VINRRDFVAGASMLVAGELPGNLLGTGRPEANAKTETISIDFARTAGSLAHFWEKATGSDRLVVGLRDQWRQDLIRVQRTTGFQSVRCHGLFDDEMGIAARGNRNLNFLYVDQIYDFMLEHGVRPFVELSFMPEAFASSSNRIFAYKGNVSPPRNWQDWHDLVYAFTDHCVKRYGLAEVTGWKFEVWNEPNIGFWAGSQDEYFELYRQSVLAVKKVNDGIQVGGPATAQLDWIPDLIQYCVRRDVPIDFVSTHVYPNDPQKQIFGKDHLYAFEQVIPQGLRQIKHQVESSKKPTLPIWLTEWSSQNPAFIADTIKNCIGLVEAMSYWTFSNVFEESGVPNGIFNNAFGLTDQWGIARPSLHAFSMLHKLGNELLQADPGPIIATRRADGSIAIAVWNLIPASEGGSVANGNPLGATAGSVESKGRSRNFRLKLNGLGERRSVAISQVNDQVGSAMPKWEQMGRPKYPSAEEIVQLRAAAELPSPEIRSIAPDQSSSEITLELPPNGMALLEIAR
jgi:xylan 1,4-beta-xylosidase